MIFDTHTHLNVEAFESDALEVIERARTLGVTEMAVVGFDMPTIYKSLELSESHAMIKSIIGWHPTEAGQYTSDIEKKIQLLLEHPEVVALGEIGLDYHWMNDDKETQERVFRRQIAIAREMNLPISIHTRDATEDTYRILKSEKIDTIGGIMHSFGEGPEWAKRFLDLGMHVSFSGVVTFKKALEVQEAAKIVPSDRLLVETDAPYLSPVPHRGKRNEPGYTHYVVDKLAELREASYDSIVQATRLNAYELFRMEKS